MRPKYLNLQILKSQRRNDDVKMSIYRSHESLNVQLDV